MDRPLEPLELLRFLSEVRGGCGDVPPSTLQGPAHACGGWRPGLPTGAAAWTQRPCLAPFQLEPFPCSIPVPPLQVVSSLCDRLPKPDSLQPQRPLTRDPPRLPAAAPSSGGSGGGLAGPSAASSSAPTGAAGDGVLLLLQKAEAFGEGAAGGGSSGSSSTGGASTSGTAPAAAAPGASSSGAAPSSDLAGGAPAASSDVPAGDSPPVQQQQEEQQPASGEGGGTRYGLTSRMAAQMVGLVGAGVCLGVGRCDAGRRLEKGAGTVTWLRGGFAFCAARTQPVTGAPPPQAAPRPLPLPLSASR